MEAANWETDRFPVTRELHEHINTNTMKYRIFEISS